MVLGMMYGRKFNYNLICVFACYKVYAEISCDNFVNNRTTLLLVQTCNRQEVFVLGCNNDYLVVN